MLATTRWNIQADSCSSVRRRQELLEPWKDARALQDTESSAWDLLEELLSQYVPGQVPRLRVFGKSELVHTTVATDLLSGRSIYLQMMHRIRSVPRPDNSQVQSTLSTRSLITQQFTRMRRSRRASDNLSPISRRSSFVPLARRLGTGGRGRTLCGFKFNLLHSYLRAVAWKKWGARVLNFFPPHI